MLSAALQRNAKHDARLQTSLACLRSSGPSNLRLFASLRMRGKRWLVARGIVFHYLFFFRFVAFALVVFDFAVSGTRRFCPMCSLRGSSIWFSAIRSL